MSNIIYKVEFIRYDEDIISVISGNTRYFADPVRADIEISLWRGRSNRNEVRTTIVEVE